MIYLIIGLIVLVAIVIAATLLSKPSKEGEDEIKEVDAECCGAHEICELDLRKLNNDIVYFEDEELDIFKHRQATEYNEEEIDEFRDILYTLKSEEIREWINSLEIRQINLPEPLKQETLSLLG